MTLKWRSPTLMTQRPSSQRLASRIPFFFTRVPFSLRIGRKYLGAKGGPLRSRLLGFLHYVDIICFYITYVYIYIYIYIIDIYVYVYWLIMIDHSCCKDPSKHGASAIGFTFLYIVTWGSRWSSQLAPKSMTPRPSFPGVYASYPSSVVMFDQCSIVFI